MRTVIIFVLLVIASGCAAALINQPRVVDEYDNVTVRIRYGAFGCMVEVVTARDVIVTSATKCEKIPRVTP